MMKIKIFLSSSIIFLRDVSAHIAVVPARTLWNSMAISMFAHLICAVIYTTNPP